jgi:Putative transposase/Transposase zinc-binding domain
MRRPPREVAAGGRQHGAAFLERYGHTLASPQHRALRAIALCRTAVLGGHKMPCDHCGHQAQSYNSCRHRRCPKCHGAAQAAWRAARQDAVLPTPYGQVIFTLPQELSALAVHTPRVLSDLLFHTVARSLQDSAGDPKHLGAEIGGLAVLHPWGQPLQHHPPLHCVLPAGGIAPEGSCWVPSRPDFFLPGRGLSRRFRRLFVEPLEQLDAQGELTWAGRCRALAEPQPWRRLLATLRDTAWLVYAKEPMRDPQDMLTSLARYVSRVAIAHHRLVALDNGRVTFRYKDYKRRGELRTRTLDAVEFLRRLMLHVPPHGFQRIRYYGFLANCVRQQKLAQCRTLRGQGTLPLTREKGAEPKVDDTPVGEPGSVCPLCHQGRMQLVETVYRHRAAWDLSVVPPHPDTS